MGLEDPNNLEDVFFTFKGENGEEHLSPSQLLAAQEEEDENCGKKTRLYPFIGANGVPQHLSPSQIYGSINMYDNNDDCQQPGIYPRIDYEPPSSKPKAPHMKKRSSKIKKSSLVLDHSYPTTDPPEKENLAPPDYQVHRCGNLAHVHHSYPTPDHPGKENLPPPDYQVHRRGSLAHVHHPTQGTDPGKGNC